VQYGNFVASGYKPNGTYVSEDVVWTLDTSEKGLAQYKEMEADQARLEKGAVAFQEPEISKHMEVLRACGFSDDAEMRDIIRTARGSRKHPWFVAQMEDFSQLVFRTDRVRDAVGMTFRDLQDTLGATFDGLTSVGGIQPNLKKRKCVRDSGSEDMKSWGAKHR